MDIVLWMIHIMQFLNRHSIGGRETKFYSLLKTGKNTVLYSLVFTYLDGRSKDKISRIEWQQALPRICSTLEFLRKCSKNVWTWL